MIDITGQKFNRLTVIERAENSPQGRACWLCECECGCRKVVAGVLLRNGSVKSCGCLQKEKAAITMETVQKIGAQTRLQDLTGQTFGYLTVIERDTSVEKNRPYYKCQCRCGNTKTVFGRLLTRGDTKSCGCLGNSVGEALIEDILKENNIPYKKEYKFKDLKDQDYLRYDFAIFNENGEVIKLIEYDGRQHTDENSIWHNDSVIAHDMMKTDYALQHNIPLIRIPYQDKLLISLEYLGL